MAQRREEAKGKEVSEVGLREGRELPKGLGESEKGEGGERTWAWGNPQPRACSIPGRLPGGMVCFPQGGSFSLPTSLPGGVDP